MAKWAFMVETECIDTKREAEFNDWYNKTHLPDALEAPGFVKATRYENAEFFEKKGKSKFLAVYEIEAEDINEVVRKMEELMEKKIAAGRFSELCKIVSRGIYKQTVTRSK